MEQPRRKPNVTPSSAARVPSVSRRLRLPSRAAWLGARARNVRRRRGRYVGVGLIVFVMMLGAYLLVPRGAAGLRARRAPPPASRVDTTALVQRVAAARSAVALADQALQAARRAESRIAAVDSTTPRSPERSHADSLARAANALSTLLQRAATVPLAESYRSLGESPALSGDSRVRVLVDSLAAVEQERDALAGGAAADPRHVALATRANALGRSLLAIGERRLEALRRETLEADSLLPGVSIGAAPAPRDTVSPRLARDSALSALADAQRGLDNARNTNAARDRIAASTGAPSRLASTPVLVAAAISVAWMVAFATGLADEMRSPRVADAAEAERLTGLRVLTLASRRTVPAERSRRAADRELVPLLDPTADAYRILAWHLTSVWPREGIVTVTGDVPVVSAIVGSNLAAVLAVDARATLLVDVDFQAEPVRGVLDLPQSMGLAAVLENRRRWSEALLTVNVGRSRSMDVLPAGRRERPVGPAEGQALVNDIVRAARRHDATVVVAPAAQVSRFRAGDDVIICAVLGTTRLATLARTVASLMDDGANARGVVLWDGAVPAPAARAT